MKCPYCGFDETTNPTTCSRCGNALAGKHTETESVESPAAADLQDKKTKSFTLTTKEEDLTGNGEEMLEFYNVPLVKFIILSIATSGIYYVYWMYKNWELIKHQRSLNISPAGRAFFGIFYFIPLAKIIFTSAQKKGYTTKFSPSALFGGLITLSVVMALVEDAQIGEYLWPLGFLDVLFFIPLVTAIHINNTALGRPEPNQQFSLPEKIIAILGLLFLILSFIGQFA